MCLVNYSVIAPGASRNSAGLDSHRWPFQIPSLSLQPSGGAKSGGALPNLFSGALETIQNSQTKGNGCYTAHALDFLVSKTPLIPPNSTVCPINIPNSRQKAPKFPQISRTQPQTKNGQYLGLRGSKNDSQSAYTNRIPPLFCGFHPPKWLKRTPRPPYQCPFGCSKLNKLQWVPNWVNGSIRAQK